MSSKIGLGALVPHRLVSEHIPPTAIYPVDAMSITVNSMASLLPEIPTGKLLHLGTYEFTVDTRNMKSISLLLIMIHIYYIYI